MFFLSPALWLAAAWAFCCSSAELSSAALPSSLRGLEHVAKSPRVLNGILEFFAAGGASDGWRIALDTTCVEGPHRVGSKSGAAWRRPQRSELLDSKWSLEASLPLMFSRSRWAAAPGEVPNATLVVFRGRASDRHELSLCRQAVAQFSPQYRLAHASVCEALARFRSLARKKWDATRGSLTFRGLADICREVSSDISESLFEIMERVSS